MAIQTTLPTTTIDPIIYQTNSFINQTMRQLKSFDRLLDYKIQNFRLIIVDPVKNRRVMSYKGYLISVSSVDDLKQYLKQKLEEKEQRENLRIVKVATKMMSLIVLSLTFLIVISRVLKMYRVKQKHYELAVKRKEKSKTKRTRIKKTSIIEVDDYCKK